MTTPVVAIGRAVQAVPSRYRAIFISDVHLGSKGCQAERLLEFLGSAHSDYLYLVGDIVDGWRLKKRWFWPKSHGDVLDEFLARAGNGTEVIYLPGNHDEALRTLIGRDFGGVRVAHEVVHRTADGRRLLVIHGDLFDSVVCEMKWLALIGAVAYDASVRLNSGVNAIRRRLGLRYWSLSGYLKDRVKAAVKFVDDFERALAAEARRRDVCGVVCGHVHKPEIRTVDDVLYVNGGDWVENCTALVEHMDGRLELLDWARRQSIAPPSALASRPLGGGKTAVAA